MSLIIKMGYVTDSSHLKKLIPYAMNEKKTEHLSYSDSGVTPEQIYKSFMATKKFYNKENKRLAYQFIFSFSKDENITPEEAFEFMKEWTEEYLGGQYDFVLGVHQDREHLHMHLVFNSVSKEGYKYRYDNGDWDRIIVPLTNKLCEKYHVSGVKVRDEGLDYSNPSTWRGLVRKDIDECIEVSRNYQDFKKNLQSDFGYKLREGVSKKHGVYLALTPPKKGKAVRNYTLGAGYTVPDIEDRIIRRIAGLPYGVQLYKRRNSYHGFKMYGDDFSDMNRHRRLDWRIIRTMNYVPYRELSFYQKEEIKNVMAAKRLYKRTNSTLYMHENSVRAINSMIKDIENISKTYRPDQRSHISPDHRSHEIKKQPFDMTHILEERKEKKNVKAGSDGTVE